MSPSWRQRFNVWARPAGDRAAGRCAQVRASQRGGRTNLLTARSIEFDAVVVAAGTKPAHDIKLVLLLQEAFRHCKAVAAWGDGADALTAAGIDLGSAGVLTADSVDRSFTTALGEAVGLHRVWERAVDVMASAVAPVR